MRYRQIAWIFLLLAIVLEVAGVSMLNAIPKIMKTIVNADYIEISSYRISNVMLSKAIMLFMIAISYYCMSLALRGISLGVAYSTWEVLGLIFVLLISFVFFDPMLSVRQYIGIAIGFIGIVCIILGEEH